MVTTAPRPAVRARPGRLPGLALVAALAGTALAAARWVPLIGAPVLGVLAGGAAHRLGARRALRPGVTLAAHRVLPVAIVLLGTQLDLGHAARVGAASLPVMLTTLTVCLVLAGVLGRALRVGRDVATLVAVGTAICGASAIAAVSPVIRARSTDVSYALSTIFLFNIAAVIAFPPLGHLLGLDRHAFGVFAGTAVNDTSSVVAVAAAYGATGTAVVVKLTRTLLIVPICLALAARRGGAGGSVLRRVPLFLVGFVLTAAANSAGLVPAALHAPAGVAETVLVTVALTGIGLGTDPGALRRAGRWPLLLGLVLWVAVTATSLGVQAVV